MDIKSFNKALPYLIQSKITALLWGHYGKGKTQVIQSFAKEKGYWFFNIRVGNLADVGDLLGLQNFSTDKEGNINSSSFFMPDWLKEMYEFCNNNPDKYALIFLDEINRPSRKDLISPIFQMALDYQLHTYKFPKNVYIVAAANPNTDEYTVMDLSDQAFISRFCHIKFTPTVSEWIEYAKQTGIDTDLITLVQNQPELLEPQLENFDIGFVKPSRRGIEKCSDLRKSGINTDHLFEELCGGLVGYVSAAAYMEEIKNSEKPIQGKEIIDNYDKYKKRITRLVMDQEQIRFDILSNTTSNTVSYIKNNFKDKSKELSTNQANNIVQFVLDLPEDLAFAAMRDIFAILPVRNAIIDHPDHKKLVDRFSLYRKKANLKNVE